MLSNETKTKRNDQGRQFLYFLGKETMHLWGDWQNKENLTLGASVREEFWRDFGLG